MPTYDYKCQVCGAERSIFQSIADYTSAPQRPTCCTPAMERKLSVVPAAAGSYALAGDRHYEGMRATDGTDISSRSKHRAYMKQDAETFDRTKADEFEKRFNAYCGQVKEEERRKAFKVRTVAYGGI